MVNDRDRLFSKLRLNKLLEFLCQHTYNNNKSRKQMLIFSCTSRNVDKKAKNLCESEMLAELMLNLLRKNQKSKILKNNYCVDDSNAKNPKRKMSAFSKAEFIIRHPLVIGAVYCNQSELVLLVSSNNSKYLQDTITYQARFNYCMKSRRFKEF